MFVGGVHMYLIGHQGVFITLKQEVVELFELSEG